MKQLLLPLMTLNIIVIYAQDENLKKAVDDVFGTNNNKKKDPFANLVEVSPPPPENLGALEKCGEGSQQGTHICVPYHQCDGNTRMIIQDGSVNGVGLIDIRQNKSSLGVKSRSGFRENSCEHFLDVCCGVPSNFRDPQSDIPVNPVTSSTPSVIPVNTPVIPLVTPVNPPVTPATPRPSSLNCGIRNANGIDFKITGNSDNEAEYGEFPWMVALLWKDFDPSRDKTLSFCGGSLIAPNVVLTGAHCVADLQPNKYKVRAGEWDTQTTKERVPYQERDVIQATVHENYTPKVVYNNVALLILSSPFDQADNIGSICLPSQDEVITSKNCFASGWGKDVFGKEGKYQVILKKIELPMVQHEPCQQALRRTRLGQIFKLHPSFICAGGELGKDTCTGDGGSPLVCPDPKNPSRYVQSGIVSWGIGCGEKNIPGVYASVAKYKNWIDNQLSRLNINSNSYTV